MKYRQGVAATAGIMLVVIAVVWFRPGSSFWKTEAAPAVLQASSQSSLKPSTSPEPFKPPSSSPLAVSDPESSAPAVELLVERYKHLQWIDAHYHGASGGMVYSEQGLREMFNVGSTILFGGVSDPEAVKDDDLTLYMAGQQPGYYIPFFSGIDLHDKNGVKAARKRFEQGFYGMGEIAAASYNSPILAKVKWKAVHPMEGFLPDLYKLCAEMKAPILLHIDPLSGMPVDKLEEALDAYPDTTFILGHANAYNTPENIEILLKGHPNLTADFFAGFTAFNPDSHYKLEDFVPLIKRYPDRFVVSSDSGYGIGYDKGLEAAYRLFDAVGDEDVNRKIAHDNLGRILQTRADFIKSKK